MVIQSDKAESSAQEFDKYLSEAPDIQHSFEPVYLNAQDLRFRNDDDTLSMSVSDGTLYPRISLRRCFAMSSRDVLISVRRQDGSDPEKDVEIGILRDLTQLDAESQLAVGRELRLHYFIPAIQRIISIVEEFGFLYWHVDTDRGEKEFVTRDNVVRAAREVSPGRWLIIDINQARFEVFDQSQLDGRSLGLLKLHLLL